ncbi:hypothetical protein F9L16_23765 [Agarivorans sp. B2Z047]|uniref:hypothetical protein n=1 Tax=Agarivorans sp. B2Z047 TaxID=2652721 RepID=UPI00128E2B73|nr:hypothetical protein [Agarivorans sp. B2Z047]MPW31972.1 hypothetical protein [Agarivorans sp. B2Z047]
MRYRWVFLIFLQSNSPDVERLRNALATLLVLSRAGLAERSVGIQPEVACSPTLCYEGEARKIDLVT